MNKIQFNERFQLLSLMVGSDQTDELFNQEYELLLNEIKADSDRSRQQEQAKRMRKLIDHQLQFQMNQWLRLNRETKLKVGPYMSAANVQ